MVQQQQTHSPRRIVAYHIAKWAWIITAWIWTSIIIVCLTQVVARVLGENNSKITVYDFWITHAVNWLVSGGTDASLTPIPIQNLLRLVALSVTFLLIAIPPLAFLLKQMLQNVQREGFDKLIDVLQQDTISPQLDVLQQQLAQQVQKQDTCIKILRQISGLLQQTPTTSDLQGLHAVSQQQQQSLQKDFTPLLQDWHYMQSKISEHMQRVADLCEQDQHTQKTISDGLEKVSFLLEGMRDSLKVSSLPSHGESGTSPNLETTTEPIPVVTPSVQTNAQ